MSNKLPIIGIPADRRLIGKHPFHVAGEKYVQAVAEASRAMPLIIPALAELFEFDALLDSLDGLLLPGSPSNVEPHRYSGPPSAPGTLHDPARDAMALPLIARAVDAGVPILAICRGFQDMNVAFGGTLHQHLHELPGHLDHRDDGSDSLETQYAPVHDIKLEPGGLLHRLIGHDSIKVNSLHSQGVQRLGAGLHVEARAPDGVIEAFRVRKARRFAVGVQWHPEWKVMSNPASLALFGEFGAASRDRAANR